MLSILILFLHLSEVNSSSISFYSFSYVIPNQPSDASGTFYVNAKLYGSLLPDWTSGVTITLSLDTNSAMTGTLSAQTNGWGEAVFTDVRSVYRGDWYMMASASGYSTGYTSRFTITTGNTAFNSVAISINPSTVAQYLTFSVSVTVKDSNGSPMLNSCPMTIVESGGSTLYGSSTSLTVTGSTSFSFYFTTAGSKTLTVNCYSTGNQTMTVSENQLTITSFTQVVFM